MLGLDRAREVKTIRPSRASSPRPGKAVGLGDGAGQPAAAARPDALGFLGVDGHARACHGTRTMQKTHVARLKFPSPATMETWVTGQDCGRVFTVAAEPSDSWPASCAACRPNCAASWAMGNR
jgi:hypothetical protein